MAKCETDLSTLNTNLTGKSNTLLVETVRAPLTTFMPGWNKSNEINCEKTGYTALLAVFTSNGAVDNLIVPTYSLNGNTLKYYVYNERESDITCNVIFNVLYIKN